ncbi:MAG: hypothetical protein AB1728_02320 [Bacteroidota bacterium]
MNRISLVFPIVIVPLSIISFSAAQPSSKQDSICLPMKYFIGDWKGTGGGESGQGTYERSYRFIFNNNYIEARNKSTYPAGWRAKETYHIADGNEFTGTFELAEPGKEFSIYTTETLQR